MLNHVLLQLSKAVIMAIFYLEESVQDVLIIVKHAKILLHAKFVKNNITLQLINNHVNHAQPIVKYV